MKIGCLYVHVSLISKNFSTIIEYEKVRGLFFFHYRCSSLDYLLPESDFLNLKKFKKTNFQGRYFILSID